MTDTTKRTETTIASIKLRKNPEVYPIAVITIPVTRGPVDCPISMIEESAPIEAPICSFRATSAM